jgi:SAM-dependent methyltransferase
MASLRYDRVRALVPDTVRTVLEVGCGQGALGYRLAAARPDRTYLGVEPDAESSAVARERLSGVPGAEIRAVGVETLPDDDTFDLVCAFEVLEHMADDRSCLATWIEHVRPGGHLLVSVPAHPHRFGPADDAAGHYRRYDPDELRRLFVGAGLEDVRVVLYGMPLGYLLERVRGRLLARSARQAAGSTPEERTTQSGRLLQPKGPFMGTLIAIGTAPFRLAQRAFPRHGVAIVARGRLPGP